jgi:Methylase involved in ubiquinone/menaquinone biosynthesis
LIARNIFAPLYYQLAQQILDRTGSESGFCLDLGSGSGYLGLALAWNSKLRVCLLNESSEMTKFAEQNIFQKMLENRVTAACGDVHCLPFEDSSVDLVVSHGSVYFWNDLPQVFREIWRVLAPGGQTFISDGFGSREVHNEVIDKMRKIEPDWHPQCHNFDDTLFDAALAAAKIRGSLVLRNENGIWIPL